jgi:hypothetical protein
MGLAAIWVDAWTLNGDHDCKLVLQKKSETDHDAGVVRSWVEKAEHFVLPLRRQFIGFVSWAEEVGQESGSFSYYVGAGINHGYSTSKKHWCTTDKIKVEDLITGSGFQEQVWEYETPWETVPGTLKVTPIPEEPEEPEEETP